MPSFFQKAENFSTFGFVGVFTVSSDFIVHSLPGTFKFKQDLVARKVFCLLFFKKVSAYFFSKKYELFSKSGREKSKLLFTDTEAENAVNNGADKNNITDNFTGQRRVDNDRSGGKNHRKEVHKNDGYNASVSFT